MKGQKCQICGENDATVHVTDLINGQDVHMCEKCAEQQGIIMPAISIGKMISSFMEEEEEEDVIEDQRICSVCGSSYSDIRGRDGKLGCQKCVETFSDLLLPFIERLQGSTEHRGKAPRRFSGVSRKRRRIRELKHQLNEAVVREDYERAASLRDEIRRLEDELRGGGAEETA